MESKFEQLMQKYGIVSEKNETSLQTYGSLPTPGTEVRFRADAASHPFVKEKGVEFQNKIKQFISDNKKKTKKYRLLISAVNTIRPGITVAGDASTLGTIATIIEQIGPVTMGHYVVPLEILEIENASWNMNGAEVPDSWNYDTEKYGKFSQAIRGYWVDGRQPKGSIENA